MQLWSHCVLARQQCSCREHLFTELKANCLALHVTKTNVKISRRLLRTNDVRHRTIHTMCLWTKRSTDCITHYLRCNSCCLREPGLAMSLSACFHLLWNRTFADTWQRFFVGRRLFVSPSQHCQSTEKALSTGHNQCLASSFLQPPRDSSWKERCALRSESPMPVPRPYASSRTEYAD